MLSSVQSGIKAVPRYIKAAMILLGDQPMVQTEVINQLIEEFTNHAERIVIPVYKGRRGHPLLVDMSFSEEIESLDPEKGLRQLLAEHPDEVLETEVNTSSVLKDIDTKQDYADLKEEQE
jgi:molybdenum cofactor cytidylyltransferase